MTNQIVEFKDQVEAVKARCTNGDISAEECDDIVRHMQLEDEWHDTWMLSPDGQWFRKANGSKEWAEDFPIALIDAGSLPAVEEMDMRQINRAVHDCARCPLSQQGRSRAVPGEGSFNADIMFIGEGPGAREDKQARPFVGASGKFLTQLINEAGYERKDVFIANVVKCRPPNNRDPQPEELKACEAYLNRQIELVNPKVIVTLGRFSMYRYFPGVTISKIHGQPKQIDGRWVVPMFHPAAALHQPKLRPEIIEDFKKLPQLVSNAV